MRRIPLTLRALVLVPLMAVLVDAMRATLACGPRAETCLEAAGRGWLGAAAVGGQALLAGATGDPAALGGGWLELAAFCTAAGGVIALTLRIAPAAAALVRGLRPSAPRLPLPAAPEPSLPL